MKEKVFHLDRETKAVSEEIEDKQEATRIINELLKKKNLSDEERQRYEEQLEKKEQESISHKG